ncbi:MAG: hypothetical protein E4H01_16455 [Lysobacterales bacterium]|nr:MAG: hypothetical protein E4H01_16455 [Xanthomonadales bacterium]
MTPSPKELPGTNTLLIGATGSGKTSSIRTLLAEGITPFCVFTEPGFEVLGDIPSGKLHWHYIPPADTPWATMIDSATKINSLSFESLTKLTDINKKGYGQFIDLLRCLNSFTCDRDGQNYGDVCEWNTDRALVLDSLSGVNIMAMNLVVGSKPVKHQGDWGVAMDNLERLVQKLCTGTNCHFVLIAHAERETDEVMGGSKIMAATLGKNLAPRIPRFFSDVVLADKTGAKFTWSTAAVGADLKARNLPIADGLPPDFGPILKSWRKQGGKAASSSQ